jgi:translocation and assembly module TamB
VKRWARRGVLALLVIILLAGASIAFLVETGVASRVVRRAIVGELQSATGARVELGEFHFEWRGLRAEVDDLTLHGKEPTGAPPFFHANRLIVRIRIISFLGHKIALDELRVEKPEIAIRVDSQGNSNVPSPKIHRTRAPWRQQLFDLQVGTLEILQGAAMYNDSRVPLASEARDFHFVMNYSAPPGAQPAYAAVFGAAEMHIAAKDYMPFGSNISGKFLLTPDAFSLDELRWNLPRSFFELRAALSSFANPNWTFQSRSRVDLTDVSEIFHSPLTPPGIVDFTAVGAYGSEGLDAEGHYSAHDVRLPYTWFHTGGIAGTGRFHATDKSLDVPDFEVRLLGGTLTGRLSLVYRDLQFRVKSRGRGVSLPALFGALDNADFPLHTLHMDGIVAVDAVNTWTGDFDHFRTQGQTLWLPTSLGNAPGTLPVTAQINFIYSLDQRQLTLNNGSIQTPDSTIQMDGTLGAVDSALETKINSRRLADFDDFIDFLVGPGAPRIIAGELMWEGRILGPLAGPTFTGSFDVHDAQYGSMIWDEVAGRLEYSPDALKLAQTEVKVGDSTMLINLSLDLDGTWSFLPSSNWSLGALATRTPLGGVQALFGISYPVEGLLSGNFQAGGTRAAPSFSGNFRLDKIDAKGWKFDHLIGSLHYMDGVIHLSNAELHSGVGAVSGDVVYHTEDRQLQFALRGAGIPVRKTFSVASRAVPVSFSVNFDLEAQGTLEAPVGKGTIHLEKIFVGDDDQGNLAAHLSSDGRELQAQIATEGNDRFKANAVVGFTHDFPIQASAVLSQLTLNTLLESFLHQSSLVGHARADGSFTVSGPLAHPAELETKAEFTHLTFVYSSVNLENSGPVRFSYRGGQLTVDHASFQGPNSDFYISGFTQFTGRRSVNLSMDGRIDLHLADGMVSGLEVQGKAEVDAAVSGTLDSTRITGKIHVIGASAHYATLPVGLSNMNGDFIFNRDRMQFNNVTAEAGGGNLQLSGSLVYSEAGPRYDVQCTATSVRVRYPPGLSWLGNAVLRFSGNTESGLLAGDVSVDRVLLTEGADLFTMFGAAEQVPSSPTTSSWLRNLKLNVSVGTVAGAQFKSTGARLDLDGNLHVRGTADHPILLGNVHVSDGTITFRGTDYSISRGDLNFANPFRFDPILNVEATTTIQQYLVTLDFSGPASHLSLAYRSDPPLGSGDIVALLALGTPSEESALRSSGTGGSQTQGFGATALLSEAISSELGGRIQKLFGISRFRVDPFLAGTATEQNAAARVTIEQQVTHNLTVTYSTNTASDQQQVIEVDYALSRNVSIVALRDINGTFGIDIKFTKRWK